MYILLKVPAPAPLSFLHRALLPLHIYIDDFIRGCILRIPVHNIGRSSRMEQWKRKEREQKKHVASPLYRVDSLSVDRHHI